MSDLQQGMDCPWFSSYDKGVPHDIVIPEGGLQNILDTAAETYGQREAIVFQNTHISYRELKELAEKLAASLRRRGYSGYPPGLLHSGRRSRPCAPGSSPAHAAPHGNGAEHHGG